MLLALVQLRNYPRTSPPKPIIPADRGIYVEAEATLYWLIHRLRLQPDAPALAQAARPHGTGLMQVFPCDIDHLPSTLRSPYYNLSLVVDFEPERNAA